MDMELAAKVDTVLQRLNDIHRETEGRLTALDGKIEQLHQKVDLRHQMLQEQVDDVCVRTDSNAAAIQKHREEDAKQFGSIETQRQVTKAKLSLLALLGGGGALSLDKLWEWLTSR